MNLKKNLLLISIILCILISISVVSASEDAADLTYANSDVDDEISSTPTSEDLDLSDDASDAVSASVDDVIEQVPEDVSASAADSEDTPEDVSASAADSEVVGADEKSINDVEKLENNNEEEDLQVENNANDVISQIDTSNGDNDNNEVLQYEDTGTQYIDTNVYAYSKTVYKDKEYVIKVYVSGLKESVGYVGLYLGSDWFEEYVYDGVATFYITTYYTGKYSCYAYYYGGYNDDDTKYYYNSDSSKFIINVKAKAKITVSNYKSYFNSGKKYKIKVKNTATGGVHKKLKLKVYLYKNGKKVSTKTVYTNSKGIYKGKITKAVGTYRMVVKIAEKGYIYKPGKAKVKVVKSKVKVKAYKDSWWHGYKSLLYVTVKDKAGKKVKVGYVKFRVNGKTYKAKVKNGVAKKYVKLPRVGKYRYTAKFINKNYYPKKAKSIVKVKRTYKTKILVSNVKGYQYKTKYVNVYVRTKKGNKKVSGGWIAEVISGSVHYHSVNSKGHAKFALTLGSNYKGYYSYYDSSFYKHYVDYYSKKAKFTYTLYYIPSTLKYKSSKKKFKVTRLYKCSLCGSKKSHSHGPYYKIVVS